MSRVRLTAIVLSTLYLGVAAEARAKLPDPSNSEVPDLITLVARGADGVADPLGTFTVAVRNYVNMPIQGAYVRLHFQNCPDIRMCADQGDPNLLVDCGNRMVSAVTDQAGRATFRVIGSATNSGASPGSIGPSLDVYADGVFLKSVRVAALDQNGLGGADGGDFSLFLADYFSGQSFARSDYDGNGTLEGNDLSLWLGAFFAAGSAQSGGATCP